MSRIRWKFVSTFLVALCVVASMEVVAEEKGDDLFGSSGAEIAVAPASGQADSAGNSSVNRGLCHCLCEKDPAAANRIKKALKSPLTPTGIDYTEAPLSEVVQDLSQSYGIPIRLDETALEEAGLSSDEKVSAQLNNVSLGSALQLLLERRGLAFFVSDEVLLITTKEAADRTMQTCIYDVRHLVDETVTPRGAPARNYEPLISAITSCITPGAWKVGGGSGDVRSLSPGFLVVLQTPSVHEEVSDFLTAFREMRDQPPLAEDVRR